MTGGLDTSFLFCKYKFRKIRIDPSFIHFSDILFEFDRCRVPCQNETGDANGKVDGAFRRVYNTVMTRHRIGPYQHEHVRESGHTAS